MANENASMVECGFDMGDGKKCHAMIRNHPVSITAHIKQAHGVAAEAASAAKPQDEYINPAIERLNARAKVVTREQLDRLRDNAPNVLFGVSGQRSELDQKTEWARGMGLITQDDHEHWVTPADVEQAASEGRSFPTHLGEMVKYGNLILTVRPKTIHDKMTSEKHTKIKADYRKYIESAVADGEKTVKAIVPPSVLAASQ